MKIISKYRDYYDSAMGLGVDNTKIWMRKDETVNIKFPLKFRDTHYSRGDRSSQIPFISLGHSNPSSPYISSFLILLAGKLYPAVEVLVNYLDAPQRFYTLYSLIRYIDKNNMSDLLKGWRGKVEEDTVQDLKDLFTLTGSEILRDFAIQHKIVIATDYSNSMTHGPRAKVLTVNPQLSRLQFQKCLDQTTVYQELEQWVGGVLTNNEPIPEPSDKEKVNIHGFDKLSFRKPKKNRRLKT
jgi:hypothetical protein